MAREIAGDKDVSGAVLDVIVDIGEARLSVVDDLGAVPSDDLRILHWNIHSSHDPSGHANSNSAAVKLIVLPMPRLRTD